MSKPPRLVIVYDFDSDETGWNVFEVVRVVEKAPSYAEAKKVVERLEAEAAEVAQP